MAKQDGSKTGRVTGQNKGVHILKRLSNNLYPVQIDQEYIDGRVVNNYTYQFTDEEHFLLDFFKEIAAKAYQMEAVEEWYDGIRNNTIDSHDKPILQAPKWVQGVYYALEHEISAGGIVLGGIRTVYDLEDSELITVDDAIARGYSSTFVTGAAGTDTFIVVHVVPDKALLDATYGNDIAQVSSNVGQILVQDGKVRYQAPKPDMEITLNGTSVIPSQTVIDTGSGEYVKTAFSMAVVAGSSVPPCNDCLPTDPTKPPVPPPTPPTPPTGLPPVPPTNGTVDSDTVCSSIFFDEGVSFGARIGDESLDFRKYGNILARQIYPAHIAGAIHDWIATFVPDFDFTCDKLLTITFQLRVSVSDNLIFAYVNFPVPFTNVTPRILSILPDGSTQETVYYFQPDRTTVQPVIPPVTFPTYSEFWYEKPHKVTIRPDDRLNGDVGYERYGFYLEAVEFIKEASVARLDLDICGIGYKKHQYKCFFGFNGLDPIKVIGTHTYIYDQLENARIEVGTGYFESGGFGIGTDAVHGFDITPDFLCPIAVDGTVACYYGTIECDHNHWGTTNLVPVFLRVYEFGTLIATNDNSVNVDQALGVVTFGLTATGTFVAGHTYQLSLQSGSFPDDHYILHSLTGFIS